MASFKNFLSSSLSFEHLKKITALLKYQWDKSYSFILEFLDTVTPSIKKVAFQGAVHKILDKISYIM